MTDTMTTDDTQVLVGQVLYDEDGNEIGEITGIYLDRVSGRPEWAAVDLGGSVTLVPLAGALQDDDGVTVHLARDQVLGAPHRRSGRLAREISQDDEEELRRHYGTTRRRRRRTGAAGGDSVTGRATSAASTARRQSREVASSAVDKGQEVASTAVEKSQQVVGTAGEQTTALVAAAKQQVAQVKDEVSVQARALLDEGRAKLEGQARSQTERLADSMRRIGSEAEALADGRPVDPGPLSDYLRQAADRLLGLADDLEVRGPEGLFDDVRGFARTRPAAFVLGAAVAGFGVGRLLRASEGGGSDELGSAGYGEPDEATEPRALPRAGARRPRAAAGAR